MTALDSGLGTEGSPHREQRAQRGTWILGGVVVGALFQVTQGGIHWRPLPTGSPP